MKLALVVFGVLISSTMRNSMPVYIERHVDTSGIVIIAPEELKTGEIGLFQIFGLAAIDVYSIEVDSVVPRVVWGDSVVSFLCAVPLGSEDRSVVRILLTDSTEIRRIIPIRIQTYATHGFKNPYAEEKVDTVTPRVRAALGALFPKAIECPLWNEVFTYPVRYPKIVGAYGVLRVSGQKSHPHHGTDFHAPLGTSIMAINQGVVVLAGSYGPNGNLIVIDHGFGIMSFYLHLSSINVLVGDSVTKGMEIAKSGQTGFCQGPGLHLQIKVNSVSVDPIMFLSAESQRMLLVSR